MRVSHWLAGLAMVVFVAAPGCEVKKIEPPPKQMQSKAHSEHDHSHEHGPNGGHVAHFEPSESHFEWVHEDDAHKLIVHCEELVSAGAKIDAIEVVVTTGSDTKKFPLVKDETAKIANSIYSIVDAELLTLIGASGEDEKGVQAKLVATIDGKSQTCLLIDEHDHHH